MKSLNLKFTISQDKSNKCMSTYSLLGHLTTGYIRSILTFLFLIKKKEGLVNVSYSLEGSLSRPEGVRPTQS